MTVRQWIARQAPPPDALRARVIELIGHGGDDPVDATPRVCLAAASAHLASIIRERRYERESALDLLAVDALVTYAFEHASSTPGIDLERLTGDAITELGALTPAHE